MEFYKRIFFIVALLLSTNLFVSCNNNNNSSSVLNFFKSELVDIEEFQNVLAQLLPEMDTADKKPGMEALKNPEYCLNYVYKKHNYKPYWFDKNGLNKAGEVWVDSIFSLKQEGIKVDDHFIKDIEERLESIKNSKSWAIDSIVQLDKSMTEYYLAISKQLLLGNKNLKVQDAEWHIENDSIFSLALSLPGYFDTSSVFPTFNLSRPQIPLYGHLLTAKKEWQKRMQDSVFMEAKARVKEDEASLKYVLTSELNIKDSLENGDLSNLITLYQSVHQLSPDGKLSESTLKSLSNLPTYYLNLIDKHMHLLRLMPQEMSSTYVWVNVPLMEMRYFRNDSLAFHCKTVVGTPSRETPSMISDMTNIVFNPPWTVPPGIIKTDIQSGINKSGVAYLNKKGLRALDGDGNDVTNSVNSSNYKSFTYRQPPGKNNSLGVVKFNLKNPYFIYLHDTPSKYLFNQRSRSASSGCVRLERAKDFAYLLLGSQIGESEIDKHFQSSKTKSINLKEKIPVYIIYMTLDYDTEKGQLLYLNNIYKKPFLEV